MRSEDPRVKLDSMTAGSANVRFGKGSSETSLGTTRVTTEIGTIKFEVIRAPTPFLLCLQDMDRLGVYFDNTMDELV